MVGGSRSLLGQQSRETQLNLPGGTMRRWEGCTIAFLNPFVCISSNAWSLYVPLYDKS